jgi:2-hydroxychromene-2-carboxylate isomerase
MSAIEFWFDFASTYSYPAAFRIGRLAAGEGVAVEWRPFLLGPIFVAQGWNDSPFNVYPAKGRYMWRDLERVCAGLGLPLRRPSQFPRNAVLAARIGCCFDREPWMPEFVRRIFAANFAEDREIGDVAVVASVLADMGMTSDVIEVAQSATGKTTLRAQTERASAAGIFGAPTFVCGDELFWGNDRLEQALAWAKGRERPTRARSSSSGVPPDAS